MKEEQFIVYKNKPTCVFWNLEDYPIPNGVEPGLIYRRIEEACKVQGCNGEVSIKFYVDKKRFSSDELLRTYSDAELQINFLPEGDDKLDRAYSVMLDIMLWIFENPPNANVFVLLKSGVGQDMVAGFETLYRRDYGFILSQKHPGSAFPSGSKAKFLTSLFDDGGSLKQKITNWKQKIANSLGFRVLREAAHRSNPKSILKSLIRDYETMRISKEIPFRIYKNKPTCVFWNMEDYPIPEGIEPGLIYRRIEEACKMQGCNGEVSIKFYVDKKRFSSDELLRTYSDAGLQINFFAGDNKLDRGSSVMLDIMLWLFENPSYANVFVLLKDGIGRDMVSGFAGLYSRSYGFILSQKHPGMIFPSGSKAKFLTSLFDDDGGSLKQKITNCWKKLAQNVLR